MSLLALRAFRPLVLRTVALCAIVALSILLAASSADASSRYSLRGEGEVILPARADARALGGAEAASGVPSLTGNPASILSTDHVRFYGSWSTDWTRIEETLPGGNQVSKDYSGLIPNLGLIFPMPRRWSFGLGLLVDRRQEGLIERPATTPDGQPYQQSFELDGNHLRIPVLLAHEFDRVQVGLGTDVLLRFSRQRWRNDFEADSLFADTNDLDTVSMWGVALRVGARVPVGDKLALGGWLSVPSSMDGSRRFENDDNDDSDDLKVDASADMPNQFGAGLEFAPNSRMRLVGDWVREGWSDVDPTQSIDTFTDVNRFSVGAELKLSSGARPWPLRVGYRTETLHIVDSNGDEIREHAFSVGSGLGLAGGRGELDGFLEYVWRGVVDESEYYEQVIRFGVTLTGLEQWSRRRRPEGEDDF